MMTVTGVNMTELDQHELVLSLEHSVWRAVMRKDRAALGELFSDDYIEITLDGRRGGKTEIVNESPQVDEIEEYAIGSEKVVWLGENRAILTYHLTLDGQSRGVAISLRDRWATSIWHRCDERWLCCFFQQSLYLPEHEDPAPQITPLQLEPIPMIAADCEAVLSFWENMAGVGLSDADTPEGLSAYIRRNPGLSLVVRHEGRIIGAVLCGHDGRRGYLHHLAVAPAYRRQGIGKELVERCLSKLGSLGIQKCNIFVYADNDDGSGFWQRNGWLDRNDLKVMQRPLAHQHTHDDH